jgi:hypothetical protein
MSSRRIFSIIIAIVVAVIFVVCIRNFLIARSETASAPCINYLRQIDAAKNQWMLDKGKTTNDVPKWDDILPYLRKPEIPKCPDGGTYTIGRIGQPPTCSIGGREHALPQGEGQ